MTSSKYGIPAEYHRKFTARFFRTFIQGFWIIIILVEFFKPKQRQSMFYVNLK